MSPKAYNKSIQEIGQKLVGHLGLKANASAATIKKKTELLLFAPYEKFNKNAKTQRSSKDFSGLSKFTTKEPEVSDWDEYKSVFEVLQSSVSKPISTADRALITQVRDLFEDNSSCLLYTSPSPRDQRGYRMPSSA